MLPVKLMSVILASNFPNLIVFTFFFFSWKDLADVVEAYRVGLLTGATRELHWCGCNWCYDGHRCYDWAHAGATKELHRCFDGWRRRTDAVMEFQFWVPRPVSCSITLTNV